MTTSMARAVVSALAERHGIDIDQRGGIVALSLASQTSESRLRSWIDGRALSIKPKELARVQASARFSLVKPSGGGWGYVLDE